MTFSVEEKSITSINCFSCEGLFAVDAYNTKTPQGYSSPTEVTWVTSSCNLDQSWCCFGFLHASYLLQEEGVEDWSDNMLQE